MPCAVFTSTDLLIIVVIKEDWENSFEVSLLPLILRYEYNLPTPFSFCYKNYKINIFIHSVHLVSTHGGYLVYLLGFFRTNEGIPSFIKIPVFTAQMYLPLS